MNESLGDNSLKNQIAEVISKLEALEQQRRALEDELNTHANQRAQYQLLGTISTSLDKLAEMGASDLFWGGELADVSRDKQLQRIRDDVGEFEKKIGAIEERRDGLQAKIDEEEGALQLLNEELAEQEREAERKAQEFLIEREGVELPYRVHLMPWSKNRDDEKRYRKIMSGALAFAFILTTLVEVMSKPPEKKQEVVLDEKIAALVVKKKAPPKPPAAKQAEEQPHPGGPTTSNATQAQVTQARAAVQNKGMLAMKGSFSDMLGGSDDAQLGSDAHVSNKGRVAGGGAPRRSVIGSQAAGGSGGISTAGISKQRVGGGGGGGRSITGGGVQIARVESRAAAGVAKDKALGNGVGPSRTDEDIQVVFDRYSSALYRIYNRELRKNPTLRGKVVLKITIAADGHVKSCVIKSTELPVLSNSIIAKVMTFNFGAKKGVHTMTVIYPIHFLPAS